MRRPHADYAAVEAALEPHQLRTVREYASAQCLRPVEWPKHAVCCVIATALAVENIAQRLCRAGLCEKDALMRASAELDYDFETLQRHRRCLRNRQRTGSSPRGEIRGAGV
jgi:hypothetical protein